MQYNLTTIAVKEVIRYFKQLEVNLIENDFNRPSQAIIQRFYAQILEIYTGCDYLNSGESTSINTLKFIKKLTDFISLIGLNSLSIREILNPDGKKFIIICTYIINFSMYRDTLKERYMEASNIINKNQTIIHTLKKKINILNDEKLNINCLLSKNKNDYDDLQNKISTMKVEVDGLRNALELIHSDYSEVKIKFNELTDKVCNSELIEHNLKEEVDLLEKQIVSNPENLYEVVEELRSLVDKEIQNIRLLNLSIMNGHVKQKSLSETSEILKNIHNLCVSINELNIGISKTENIILNNESQIKRINSFIKSKNIKLNHINKQISLVESKIESLTEKDKSVSKILLEKIENVKKEYDELCENKKKTGVELNENNKKIHSLLLEKSKIENEFTSECNEIYGLLTNLITQVEIMKFK